MKDFFKLDTMKYGIFAICAICIFSGFNDFSKSVVSYYFNANNFVNEKTLSDDAIYDWTEKKNSVKVNAAERRARAEKKISEHKAGDKADIFKSVNSIAAFVLFMFVIGLFFGFKKISWGKAILATATSAVLLWQFWALGDTLIEWLIAGKVSIGWYAKAVAENMLPQAFATKLFLLFIGFAAMAAAEAYIYKTLKRDERKKNA